MRCAARTASAPRWTRWISSARRASRSSLPATYCVWQGSQEQFKEKPINVNIIDTPGHVDFTIEVERALRVLDGAILVLDSGKGVQSQSITVDRQMKRYHVPRIAFVNKMDNPGANYERVSAMLKEKLGHHSVMIQLPMGAEHEFAGIIDPIIGKAFYFDGQDGETHPRGRDPRAVQGGRQGSPREDDRRRRRRRRRARREVHQRGAHLRRRAPRRHPPRDARPSR